MRLIQLLTAFSFSLLFFSCSISKTTTTMNGTKIVHSPTITSGLVHTVYFWFRDDATAQGIAEFKESLQLLGTIESIDHYYFGPPADTDSRGVVDNTFGICLNVFFQDIAAHDAYQVDPIHLGFIEKCKDLWTKVIVYDNVIN